MHILASDRPFHEGICCPLILPISAGMRGILAMRTKRDVAKEALLQKKASRSTGLPRLPLPGHYPSVGQTAHRLTR